MEARTRSARAARCADRAADFELVQHPLPLHPILTQGRSVRHPDGDSSVRSSTRLLCALLSSGLVTVCLYSYGRFRDQIRAKAVLLNLRSLCFAALLYRGRVSYATT